MPDPNLRRVVGEKLRSHRFTQPDMLRLRDLVAFSQGIANLTGLEHATNLVFLDLGGNRITDIRPLAGLTRLETLRLWHNRITDISPLAGLKRLKEIGLNDNQIEDFTPLLELTDLETLQVKDNPGDVTPILALNPVDLEICDVPGYPIAPRIQDRDYPSVFAAWMNIINIPTLSHEQRLARHDLYFCCPLFGLSFMNTEHSVELVGNIEDAIRQRKALESENPNMVLLVPVKYFTGLNSDAYPEDSPLWLRDKNGNRVIESGWGEALLDFTKPEVQEYAIQQAIAVSKCGLFDGIFLDHWNEDPRLGGYQNLEAEHTARDRILQGIRAEVGDNFLIMVNANRSKIPRWSRYINGTFMETGGDLLTGKPGYDAWGYTYTGLQEIESTLRWAEGHFREPRINGLEGWGVMRELPDSPTNLSWMRIFTTMSLTHSDGYVLYTIGSATLHHEHPWDNEFLAQTYGHANQIPHVHDHDHYWYDFWDADLGQPIGEKAQRYENRDGLFIREFTNGWAVYNRSGKAQEIRLSEQATGAESGLRNTIHTIPDLDGEIYLKTVGQITPGKYPPLYWIDAKTDTLYRLVGDKVENLVPRIQNATSLAVDTAGERLYWTEKTSDRTGKIQRASLDGTNVQLVRALTSTPLDIALDTASGKLYLSNAWGKIQRMSLDGSNFQSNFITDLEAPQNLVLDTTGGQLYWTEQTGQTTGKVQRANLDGSNVQLVKGLTSAPRGMDFDSTHRKLYVTNAFGKLQRMDLDGSSFQPNFITGLVSPGKVAVDVVGGKVYWTEKDKLRRANLNGENIQDVITGLGELTNMGLGIDSMGEIGVAAAPMITPVVEQTQLLANYPNPFNPETWIPYQLATNANVEIHIYNIHGVLVRRLELGHQLAGTYTNRGRAAYWDGRNDVGERVASGIYFYQLQADNLSLLRKMLILK